MEFYGSNLHNGFNESWAPKINSWPGASFQRFPFTRIVAKEIKTLSQTSGGPKEKETSLNVSQNTIHIKRVKASHLQVACIFQPLPTHHRNRKSWIWISLLSCQAPLKSMMPYGPWSNRLTNMTHFLPILKIYTAKTCAEIQLGCMTCLHVFQFFPMVVLNS